MTIVLPAMIVIVSFLYKVAYTDNAILKHLGKYSLEIYVLQGIVYMLLRNNFWTTPDFLYVILAIPGILFLSYVVHPLFMYIQGSVRNTPKR